jgi:hypothetical protein
MSSNRHRELPRPEDRRRGDLERWLGGGTEPLCWRSEAFAEDLPAVLPVIAAAPPPHDRRPRLQHRWAWSFAAPLPLHPR